MTITRTMAEDLLVEAEMEVGRFAWEGTFADYLQRVIDDPSITRLSHKLVYDSILAEGVEEEEQVKVLSAIGCDYIQGYYFSRPVPAEEIPALIQTNFSPRETDDESSVLPFPVAVEK